MCKRLRYELNAYKNRRNPCQPNTVTFISNSQPVRVARCKLTRIKSDTVLEMITFLIRDFGITINELAHAIKTQPRIVEKILRGEDVKIPSAVAYKLVLIFLDNRA